MNKNRKALIGVAAIAGAVIVIVVATGVFIEAEEAEEITTQQAQSIVANNPGYVFEVIREVMDECVSEALFFF
jgi:cell division protein FtsN